MADELEVTLKFDVSIKKQTFRENDEGFINEWVEEVDRNIYIDETDLNELEPVKFKELILTLINKQL
jgi:hypothetical protein